MHHKVVDFISDQAERALDHPLGRLDRFIPDEKLARAQRFAGDQAITWSAVGEMLVPEKRKREVVILEGQTREELLDALKRARARMVE